METSAAITIRAFDGSLADAQGLLAVEGATFDESPYDARQIRALLDDGRQHAWLARSHQEVVGFVIAFATYGLSGPSWEIDLLAVRRPWRGQGLATRLIRAASARGWTLAARARAVVAGDNPASATAFVRAGFRPAAGACQLFVFRPGESRLSPGLEFDGQVWATRDQAQAGAWLAEPPLVGERPGLTLLLAEQAGRPAGYAELLEVQTLLYRGAWLESLVAAAPEARRALVQAAVGWAVDRELDEIGMMVPEGEQAGRQAFQVAGFRSLGEFRWLTARLPLPGLAGAGRG